MTQSNTKISLRQQIFLDIFRPYLNIVHWGSMIIRKNLLPNWHPLLVIQGYIAKDYLIANCSLKRSSASLPSMIHNAQLFKVWKNVFKVRTFFIGSYKIIFGNLKYYLTSLPYFVTGISFGKPITIKRVKFS